LCLIFQARRLKQGTSALLFFNFIDGLFVFSLKAKIIENQEVTGMWQTAEYQGAKV